MKTNLQYFIYYLWGRILLWFCTEYIFIQTNFFSFIQDYWRYLIIVSISYISYCYLIKEEEKKYKEIQKILFIWNIYLFLHIFFRPLLNIEAALFLVLAICIFIIWNTKQLKKSIKIPIQICLGIISGCIIISWIFYLYPDPPDKIWFISQQTTQLTTISEKDIPKYQSYITITNLDNKREQEIQIREGTNKYLTNNNIEIKYISQTIENSGHVYLLFPNSEIIEILPQSLLQISDNTIQIKNWWILTFDTFFDSKISTQWQTSTWEQITYEEIIQNYKENYINHLKEQIWFSFTSTIVARTINKTALSLLSKLFPGFFSQNLKNYYAFEEYFQEENNLIFSEKYKISQEYTSTTNLWEIIKNNSKIWKQNLNIF